MTELQKISVRFMDALKRFAPALHFFKQIKQANKMTVDVNLMVLAIYMEFSVVITKYDLTRANTYGRVVGLIEERCRQHRNETIKIDRIRSKRS